MNQTSLCIWHLTVTDAVQLPSAVSEAFRLLQDWANKIRPMLYPLSTSETDFDNDIITELPVVSEQSTEERTNSCLINTNFSENSTVIIVFLLCFCR